MKMVFLCNASIFLGALSSCSRKSPRIQAGEVQGNEVQHAKERMFEIAPGVSITMCWIPSEKFVIGGLLAETQFEWGETTKGNGYWMGKAEVTQAQWMSVMDGNPSVIKGDDLPVHNLSWLDVYIFTLKLNSRIDSYPAEMQWKGDLLEWFHDEYVDTVADSDLENPTTAFYQVSSGGYWDSFGDCYRYPLYYDGPARSSALQGDGNFGFRLMLSGSLFCEVGCF